MRVLRQNGERPASSSSSLIYYSRSPVPIRQRPKMTFHYLNITLSEPHRKDQSRNFTLVSIRVERTSARFSRDETARRVARGVSTRTGYRSRETTERGRPSFHCPGGASPVVHRESKFRVGNERYGCGQLVRENGERDALVLIAAGHRKSGADRVKFLE